MNTVFRIIKYVFWSVLLVLPGVPLLAFGLNVFLLIILGSVGITDHGTHVFISVISVGCSGAIVGVLQIRFCHLETRAWRRQVPAILLLGYSLVFDCER